MIYVLIIMVLITIIIGIQYCRFVVENWITGRNYKSKIINWWKGKEKEKTILTKQGKVKKVTDENNNPVTEHVNGKKDIILKKISKLAVAFLSLTVMPALLIILINNIGTIGMSIIFMVISSVTISSLSKKVQIFGNGLFWGFIAGILNYIFPEIFTGTILITCYVIFFTGFAVYFLEIITDKNLFPGIILIPCILFIFIRIYWAITLAPIDSGFNFHVLSSFFENINLDIILTYFPEINYVQKESDKIGIFLFHILKAVQWFIVCLLIWATTLYGEIRDWLEKIEFSEKLRDIITAMVGFFISSKTKKRL